MNKFFIFCVLVFASVAANAVPARVGYIVDGDTFAAQVNLQDDTEISVRVRIRNVDTPEMNGSCTDEVKKATYAKQRLGEIIPVGSVVELSDVKDDKYLGRIDARVADNIGRDVGRLLISEGVGRKYNGGRRLPWCE